MKKYLFVLILLTNTSLLFAQNSDWVDKPEIKIDETSLISKEKADERSFAFDNRVPSPLTTAVRTSVLKRRRMSWPFCLTLKTLI